MDPFTLGILIAAAVTAVVTIGILALDKVLEWFRSKKSIATEDKDILGVIIAEQINNKEFVHIPGVFSDSSESVRMVQAMYNSRTGEVEEARAVKGNKIDEDLEVKFEDGDGMIVVT